MQPRKINDDDGLLKSSSTTSSGDKGNNDSHCRRSELCESVRFNRFYQWFTKKISILFRGFKLRFGILCCCSSDDTFQLVLLFESYMDSKIRVIKKEFQEISFTYNFGLRSKTSSWLYFFLSNLNLWYSYLLSDQRTLCEDCWSWSLCCIFLFHLNGNVTMSKCDCRSMMLSTTTILILILITPVIKSLVKLGVTANT